MESSVTIGDGDAFVYDGAKAGTDSSDDVRVAVRNGSSLTVADGGRMTVTNLRGQVALDSSTLTVAEGGLLELAQTASSDRMLYVKNGSTLDVRGRVVAFCNTSSSLSKWPIMQTGGDIRLSGTGRIEVPKCPGTDNGNMIVFGSGKTTLTNEARIVFDHACYAQNLLVCPTVSGVPAEMELSGHSAVTNLVGNNAYALYVGNHSEFDVDPGTARLTVCDQAALAPRSANEYGLFSCSVGWRCGTAEMRLSHGPMRIWSYSLSVGWSEHADEDEAVTGKFVLSDDASVDVWAYAALCRGGANSRKIPLTTMYGLRVGYWANAAQVEGRPVKGVFEMSGAGTKLSVGEACAVIGAGKAEGTFAMTGGDVRICERNDRFEIGNNDANLGGEDVDYAVYSTNANLTAVGMLGGKGTLDISGGRFFSNVRTFVGGCRTNEWFDGAYNKYGTDNYVADLHDAEGLLRVSGGEFVCSRSVVVGSDGTGTVEIGPAGTLAADALVLSNQTASVMRFVFGEDGFSGWISVSDLTIAPGAKLEIDLKDYAQRRNFKIISAARVTGDFAPDDITILGTGKLPETTVVERTSAGYRVRVGGGPGTILFIR